MFFGNGNVALEVQPVVVGSILDCWSESASCWINSNDLTFSLTFSLTGMTLSIQLWPWLSVISTKKTPFILRIIP